MLDMLLPACCCCCCCCWRFAMQAKQRKQQRQQQRQRQRSTRRQDSTQRQSSTQQQQQGNNAWALCTSHMKAAHTRVTTHVRDVQSMHKLQGKESNYTSQLYKRTYRNTCTRQSANVKSSTKQKQLYTCMSIYTPRTVTAREVDKQYKTT